MKITTALITLSTVTVRAFAPSSRSTTTTTRLSSTIEKTAPERIAPDAGWEPEWEGRTGLSPDEFMKSDMNKPDLSGMWECPLTRWDSEG